MKNQTTPAPETEQDAAGAVGNAPATVANTVAQKMTSKTAQAATQRVFDELVKLDAIKDITDDLHEIIAMNLRDESFMSIQLELSDDQKKKIQEGLKRAITLARDKYIAALRKDDRTKSVVAIVESNLVKVIDETLAAIGQEINRGAVINTTAVKADTKGKDHNSIELNHIKDAGDITIPTRGIFISTNCVEIIQNSCKVVVPTDKKAEAKKEKTDAKE